MEWDGWLVNWLNGYYVVSRGSEWGWGWGLGGRDVGFLGWGGFKLGD
jgi:hypothetical protein